MSAHCSFGLHRAAGTAHGMKTHASVCALLTGCESPPWLGSVGSCRYRGFLGNPRAGNPQITSKHVLETSMIIILPTHMPLTSDSCGITNAVRKGHILANAPELVLYGHVFWFVVLRAGKGRSPSKCRRVCSARTEERTVLVCFAWLEERTACSTCLGTTLACNVQMRVVSNSCDYVVRSDRCCKRTAKLLGEQQVHAAGR
jgi:hypothetical protein